MEIEPKYSLEDCNRAFAQIFLLNLIRRQAYSHLGWGLVNIAAGLYALHFNTLNLALVAIGLFQLYNASYAIRSPTVQALTVLIAILAIVGIWNIGITSLFPHISLPSYRGLGVIQLIAAALLLRKQKRLAHAAVGPTNTDVFSYAKNILAKFKKLKPSASDNVIEFETVTSQSRSLWTGLLLRNHVIVKTDNEALILLKDAFSIDIEGFSKLLGTHKIRCRMNDLIADGSIPPTDYGKFERWRTLP